MALKDSFKDFATNIGTYADHVRTPVIKLGVTGLARSGKTVFITSLIHNLLQKGRMPFFEVMAGGRFSSAYLVPQPDDAIPRFSYEKHISDLTRAEPVWPESTSKISQLRLVLEYKSARFFKRNFGASKIYIDIIDYPGEWLLDLPLLTMSYEEWAKQAIPMARRPDQKTQAEAWLEMIATVDPLSEQNEDVAEKITNAFKDYLMAHRAQDYALSTLPPGRFLMPGDLAGSPALTFAPLQLPAHMKMPRRSLWSLMQRRFEAYKDRVVKPFFKAHFIGLDRQIVLVDAMSAINAGPQALQEMERALADVLQCFNPGKKSWLSEIWKKRIDKIVFAATKADHLHHINHDRLEAVMQVLAYQAIEKSKFSGALVKGVALASLRATREAEAAHESEALPCIIGRPLAGEVFKNRIFDGKTEVAIFPGDLPENAQDILQSQDACKGLRFVKFSPPIHNFENGAVNSQEPLQMKDARSLPHIRLDRVLEFLIGDKLK